MNPPTPKPPSRDTGPQHVGFECRVCQTRMYAPPDRVGKLVRCPDCGAKTEVPPPVPVKAKVLPAALEGEQYELWDVDAAPSPSELRAAQPEYIAIECRLCQSLFYATPDQVGRELPCPDCGTPHVVPPPPAPKRELPVTRGAYPLDEASAPGERPTAVVPPRRPLLYEEEAKRERAAQDARRGKRGAQQFDARGRPIMPRWPLITGVVSFLFSPGVPVRWLALSAVAAAVGGMAMNGASAIGVGGGFVSTGMNAIGGVCFFIVGCVLGAFWLAALASIVLAIVVESSEGNSRVHDWPPANPVEWLPGLIQFVVAGFVSLFPGWIIAQLVPGEPTIAPPAIACSAIVSLPVILLSQLDLDSPFGVLSGRVLMSLVRCPLSWLLFYLEWAAIVAGCYAATDYGIRFGVSMLAGLVPLYVVAMLLFARLLGRLGWKLGESLPASEP